MAHSDDPPFLNVGTEVSAKYRGAFCEATIKVAKKLVKCKVSYSKGQTAVVNHDTIRGSLKVNAQVEVKQPDGQAQPATILKLMDNTTYTVVFDDGDERTLRRSSLCLKGARHFDESETLNHLPLTDPENFGTPVQKVKIGKKRHRNSLGPSVDEDVGSKKAKGSSYSADFPVGKIVFFENDRRRSSWLPAVVVPAHYLEESELTTDKLCIRSFKDGRFHAVPREELHDFAPDKEPLLSMLEGEIQAMYLDKPSIERAMAYMDTRELPWDMDLFDKGSTMTSPPDVTIQEEEELEGEELTAKREEFKNKLKAYYDSKGISWPEQPMSGASHLDLHKLYTLIKDNGGMDRVTQEMKWRSISLQMGFTPEATPSTAIRMAYKKYLYGFEMFEKGKGKPSKDTPLRRKTCETAGESDEDGEEVKLPSKVEEKQPSKGVEEKQATPTTTTPTTPTPITAKLAKKLLKESSRVSLLVEKVDKLPETDRTTGEKTGVERTSEEMVPMCTPKAEMCTPKAEKRVPELDPDDLQLESSSSYGDDSEEHHTPMVVEGVEPSKTGYEEGNRVLIWYGKGKQQLTYEAKIIGVDRVESGHKEYLVHYSGWNIRYDEWVDESRIAGKLFSPSSKGTTRITQKAKNLTPGGGSGRKTKGKDNTGIADSPQMENKESSGPKDSGIMSTSPHAQVVTTSSPVAPVATAAASSVTTPSVAVTTPSVPVAMPSVSAGTPNTGGKAVKGRGGRRRKISSSMDSSDCNSPSIVGVAVEEYVDTVPRVPSKVMEMKSIGEAKTTANMVENPQAAANVVETCSSEQAEGSKKESGCGGCAPVESCSEEPTNGRSAGRSPSMVPAVEEKPTLPKEVVLKVKPEALLKVKVEEVKDDEVCESRDVGKVEEEIEERKEEEEEMEERKVEESRQVKLVVDDEVFNDDLEEEDEGDVEMELGRNSSSNSSIHPDPVGSSPPMSDTNSPDDAHLLTSPSKREDRSDEALNSGKSQSEKGVSPPPATTKMASCTPDRRRKWKHLTSEEYEERVKARREELNFSIDASSLMQMSTAERIQVIQDRIRELQKRWQDLKAEVTYLDRRKRTARRKEKEG